MNLGNISPVGQKLIVGGVLFAAWSYLVYTGKVPATDYVENIKIGLGGLGLYHVVTNTASKQTPPAQ
ncbi:hypothetical protein [Paraburkholderia tropica]|uniref:hypothetical protein n=1 Tax=Paraburkholderia tropica TaxID=92647 RepID=UPI0007EC7708|nr:hypothetical protein [Paraburkholderia tropica]OBR52314.1 hypothetical protein A6456_10445 [Paraburkholderia tropica]